jgi:hypothetical protein
MQRDDLRFMFPKAKHYAFVFENAHLLLVSWDRDDTKLLFVIQEHQADALMLDYPGQTFTHRVMDIIEHIFFVQLAEGDKEPRKYVLGSYFVVGNRAYGAYYPEAVSAEPEVVLFRIAGEPPNLVLDPLGEEEYPEAAAAFREQHSGLLDITLE